MKKHLWTFNNRTRNHGRVKISKDGFVGETPIEDFGNYLLTDDHLSPENAFELFLKLTNKEEKP
jgi:hypothetical protein